MPVLQKLGFADRRQMLGRRWWWWWCGAPPERPILQPAAGSLHGQARHSHRQLDIDPLVHRPVPEHRRQGDAGRGCFDASGRATRKWKRRGSSRTKTQFILPSSDAVLLLLFGRLRSGAVKLRTLAVSVERLARAAAAGVVGVAPERRPAVRARVRRRKAGHRQQPVAVRGRNLEPAGAPVQRRQEEQLGHEAVVGERASKSTPPG